MATTVSLRELVDEMEGSMEGFHIFVNRQTGEVYSGNDDSLEAAESDEDEDALPKWQWEIVVKLKEVLASSDWIEVPRRSGQEEYALLERFSLERCSSRVQEELLTAIRGRGAFRRFKNIAERRGVLDQWYVFRRAAIADDLAGWLVANGIAYQP